MNKYKCSDGSKVNQSQIDRNVRAAKQILIDNCIDKYGYVFCQECGQNDCQPVDCSHNKSVDECKKEGKTELCWAISNMKLRGRPCHKKYDKSNLQFSSSISAPLC